MSRVIVLDSGPLGLLTNPKKTSEVLAASTWSMRAIAVGHRLVVPAIADFEVRRELERAGKGRGITHLDAFNAAVHGRYIPLSEDALRLASKLWAQARNAGTPTADPKELDCDVLIAAQTLTLGVPHSDLIVATSNIGHLSQFVPADLWQNITP